MRKFWERLRENTGGATTLTLCLSAPIMIASLGLGIDTSVNYFAQERLQNAADQAAMSIARAIVANSAADLQDEAEFIAYKAGFDVLNGSTVVVNNPPTSGPNIGSANYLEVRITSRQAQFFSFPYSAISPAPSPAVLSPDTARVKAPACSRSTRQRTRRLTSAVA